MRLDEFIRTTGDAITGRRVFGEPYSQDGTTIITAATVKGGGGGGGGNDKDGQEGEGGGFGLRCTPAGTYVIKGDEVRWIPAVDVNRVITAVAAVAIVFLVTRARTERGRSRLAAKELSHRS